MNGCICCTVRQDLVTVFHKFAKRFETGLKLDGVIIETTGMADPAPVAQTFFVDEMTQSFFRLDGIVTMEDVIETLLGVEIVDESDKTVDMQVLARRSWERRARRVGLNIESSPKEEKAETHPENNDL